MFRKFSYLLEESIEQLKKIYAKISNKEQLKLEIQKIFTKIRNQLNDREDEILLEVNKKFDSIFFEEDIIKDNEKLPNNIKSSLNSKNIIYNGWNDENTLSSLINECINIENNIKNINIINKNIKQYNSNNIKTIMFSPQKNGEINSFLETIKDFGKVYYNQIAYQFKQCPNNISRKRKYNVCDEKDNILAKTGDNHQWMGTFYENEMKPNNKEFIWKVKILKTKEYNIIIGIASNDFDVNSSIYNDYGWYYYCYNSIFRSGPPHN